VHERDFDLILYGATSFVGRLLCRRLVERTAGTDLRWAIAGRNPAELERVAADSGADVERIVADAHDTPALAALAERTAAVVSTVGPYARHGSDLVAVVAAAGTDYCDLTGEPHWMRAMIDAHQSTAASSGARIVHACGFDSVPSDLGVWFTQREASTRLGRPCNRIAMRVHHVKGGVSGGTVASALGVADEARRDAAVRSVLRDPYALAPAGDRSGPRQPEVTVPRRDELSGEWVAPFVMAATNTKVVLRSHALLGRPWGEDFLYDEAMAMGEGPTGIVTASAVTAATGLFALSSALPPTRWVIDRFVPKPGTGPDAATREAGSFDLRFHGRTADGRRIVTKVTGDADPGYGSTAKMLAEVSLALGTIDRTAVAGGFWTPATMFGDALVDRLADHAGIGFEVVSAG
jgi:short subunit dehydrogenase-like uncharacterized protein